VAPPKKLFEIFSKSFLVIFAFGELYCFAVIFRLHLSDIALRAVKGEYNITFAEGKNITMPQGIISLCA